MVPPAPVIKIVLFSIRLVRLVLSNLVSARPNKSSISIGRSLCLVFSIASFNSEIFGRRARDMPSLSEYFRRKSRSILEIFGSVIIIFVTFCDFNSRLDLDLKILSIGPITSTSLIFLPHLFLSLSNIPSI